MMKLSKLYIVTRLFSTDRSSLMPPTKKICKDCVHFIGDSLECRKFGDIDLITGKVSYPYARTMRTDEKKCGQPATHFEENYLKIITVPYYFVKNTSFIMLPIGLLGLCIFAPFFHK